MPPAAPVLRLQQYFSHYTTGEKLGYAALPAGATLTLHLHKKGSHAGLSFPGQPSFGSIPLPDEPGTYLLWATQHDASTASAPAATPPLAAKSNILTLTLHPADLDPLQLSHFRSLDHQLSTMVDISTGGVMTLTAPLASPPACPRQPSQRKWRPTACYEGATTLVNELPAYYENPLAYYTRCLDLLLEKNTRFLTWHDILDHHPASPHDSGRPGVLIQFDVDAGPRSLQRIAPLLLARNIRATVMVHHQARHWYEYDLSPRDIAFYQHLEQHGWTVGYHNNTLTTLVGASPMPAYSPELLSRAWDLFHQETAELARHFDLRTFTHHGGNVLNLAMGAGADTGAASGLVCVDKAFSPHLWSAIATMWSDGGFQSRPLPLLEKCNTIDNRLHFIRNHPLKYGNFPSGIDIPVIEPATGGQPTPAELARQTTWFSLRHVARDGFPLSNDSPDKPISSRFGEESVALEKINLLRADRGKSFSTDYPWPLGDPRVFWWRFLDACAPRTGTALNVGALPPAQRREHEVWLSPDLKVIEVDTDPARQPDILGDIVTLAPSHDGQYDAVFLFGLPYFGDPKSAVHRTYKLLKPGGIALIGFCADTHPKRGGVWLPETRPVWRDGMICAETMTLKTKLWSFSPDSFQELLRDIPCAACELESANHYWFVNLRA